MMAAGDGATAPQSQTLDRGLRILEHLAAAGVPQPIMDIAAAVGLHRSITYRLLRTLEDHQLVERDPTGRFGLGIGTVALARGVRTTLQSAVLPELTALVESLRMTAFMVVRSGDEAVTVVSIEPQQSAVHVTYRPGTRHPVDQGAPGLALLMPEPPRDDDREALREARRTGWATSHGEVIPGVGSVAAPVTGPGGSVEAALAVVSVDHGFDVAEVGPAVVEAARAAAERLR
jgi:DNA-binding IclR family transcriptional regulator